MLGYVHTCRDLWRCRNIPGTVRGAVANPVTPSRHTVLVTTSVDQGWRRFARWWGRAAGVFGGAAIVMSSVIRATSGWSGWDAFDPWTVGIPTAFAGSAVLALVLGLWAFIVRPERRWTRRTASVSLFATIPGAYVIDWASRHPGFGIVEIAATVLVSIGLVVLIVVALGLPLRGLLAVVDRRRRRSDRPTLDQWLVAWMRSKRRLQVFAAFLVVASSLWLLIATFLPDPGPQRVGAVGTFVFVLRRLGLVANELAIAFAAGGVVMWFQEDRFWGRDPKRIPQLRRVAGRQVESRSRRAAKHRWASKS